MSDQIHILNEHVSWVTKSQTAFCGESLNMLFHFTGLDHASASVQQFQGLVPCKKCVKAAFKLFKEYDKQN